MRIKVIRHGYCLSWVVWRCVQVNNPAKKPHTHTNSRIFWFHYPKGPISSSFVNRYGCRAVTIAGAILASACLAVSVLAPNVFTLIITIGKHFLISHEKTFGFNFLLTNFSKRFWCWVRLGPYLFAGKVSNYIRKIAGYHNQIWPHDSIKCSYLSTGNR